ncbi:hypothetical protein GCM10011581_14070 [Saccharopolyspora subtropica]|uniref:Ig-like domain-containing protein n=1 Tax=Saccharopolyspora thermophila TaxID=89367 RepID=A0A917JQ74_9PSEU|nr:hypothetical protein [Saccharopolyspora subtropica]GGI78157.1 hypothetical protein GCM10011581_14070 [Saccharopolyspora subtropica]
MGIRRDVTVALAALGTLAGGAAATATAWANPPLHVEMSQVRCFDPAKFDLTAWLPKGIRIAPQPTVLVTVRSSTGDARPIAYSVTVDGQHRASGSVSGGGISANGVTVANGRASRIVVTTSDKVVVLDRVVTGRC